MGGGELHKLSYISLDDDDVSLDLEQIEIEDTDLPATVPQVDNKPQNTGYQPLPTPYSKCDQNEVSDPSASFWEQSGTPRIARRRRRRYNSYGSYIKLETDKVEDTTTGRNRKRTHSGSKFKISVAAVFLKKIQKGTLGMCVTCGPHMTQ